MHSWLGHRHWDQLNEDDWQCLRTVLHPSREHDIAQRATQMSSHHMSRRRGNLCADTAPHSLRHKRDYEQEMVGEGKWGLYYILHVTFSATSASSAEARCLVPGEGVGFYSSLPPRAYLPGVWWQAYVARYFLLGKLFLCVLDFKIYELVQLLKAGEESQGRYHTTIPIIGI